MRDVATSDSELPDAAIRRAGRDAKCGLPTTLRTVNLLDERLDHGVRRGPQQCDHHRLTALSGRNEEG